jgi:hypothetical protein
VRSGIQMRILTVLPTCYVSSDLTENIPRLKYKKGSVIPVVGRGGPQGRETLRFPYFLDSRFTDGGKVVSLTRRPPFTPKKIPGTHFFKG